MIEYDRPSAPSEIAWTWRDVGAAILLLVAGGAALLVLVRGISAIAGLGARNGLASLPAYLAALGICGLMLLGVYLFAARRSGWAALGVRPAPWQALVVTPPLFVFGLVAAGLVSSAVARLQGGDFENPQVTALTGGRPFDLPTLVMVFLLVAVVVPITEELFFRGMIYPLLRRRWNPLIAIVANAAIFAAFHLIPIVFPALFVIGLLLAFLREWSGSIIPCILYHALQNGVALIAINALLSQAT